MIEILERNVSLYKEEDSFVHYLVELAVYLMEYEYDWSESCVAAPEIKLPGALANAGGIPGVNAIPGVSAGPGVSAIPTIGGSGGNGAGSGAAGKSAVANGAAAIPGLAPGGGRTGKAIVSAIKAPVSTGKSRSCPYCGTDVGDQILCPSCRNLTR